MFSPERKEAFYRAIEKMNDRNLFSLSITHLERVPREYRDYRWTYALVRALENYAIIGDYDQGTPVAQGDAALIRAIHLLETVREEGTDQAPWHMRMAYAYQYLEGLEKKAIPFARRWAQLDPVDENARAVLQECQEAQGVCNSYEKDVLAKPIKVLLRKYRAQYCR